MTNEERKECVDIMAKGIENGFGRAAAKTFVVGTLFALIYYGARCIQEKLLEKKYSEKEHDEDDI